MTSFNINDDPCLLGRGGSRIFRGGRGGGWLVPWDCQIQITENYSTRDTGNATNILAKITCNYNEVSVQSLCLISSITVFLKFLLL